MGERVRTKDARSMFYDDDTADCSRMARKWKPQPTIISIYKMLQLQLSEVKGIWCYSAMTIDAQYWNVNVWTEDVEGGLNEVFDSFRRRASYNIISRLEDLQSITRIKRDFLITKWPRDGRRVAFFASGSDRY